MSFLGQNVFVTHAGSLRVFMPGTRNQTWPPTSAPSPLSSGPVVRGPQLHSANPINKGLRKFIRKWAFYRFR